MSQIFKMADDKWYNPSTGQLGQEPTNVASPATDTMNVGSNPYAYDRTGEVPAAESQPINTLYQTSKGDVVDLNKILNTRGEELQSYIQEQGLTPYGSGSPTTAGQPYHNVGQSFTDGSGGGGNVNVEKEGEKAPISSALDQLVANPNPFTDEEAKQYAQLTGASNYKQFIGGVGGQTNPLYIGPENLDRLQKDNRYSTYQIQQATTQGTDGSFYWNPNININDIPKVPPGTEINNFSKDILNVVAGTSEKSDILTPKDTGVLEDTPSALEVYNSLMQTPQLQNASDKVMELRYKLDEFDEQLEDLKKDIEREVRGSAPESYVNALAAVRGNEIMRLRRQVEREYNMALADYNSQKEIATAQMEMIIRDNENRYNRTFEMLKFMEAKATNAKNMDSAYLYAMLNLPEGTPYTFSDGTTVHGLKRNENISSGIINDADGSSYLYAVDLKTGQEAFPRVKIGDTPTKPIDMTDILKNIEATGMINAITGIASGKYIAIPSPDGKSTVYADVDTWSAVTGRTFENKKGSSWIFGSSGHKEFWKHEGANFVLDANVGATPYDIRNSPKEGEGEDENKPNAVESEKKEETPVFKPGNANQILVDPSAMNWMFSDEALEGFNKNINK